MDRQISRAYVMKIFASSDHHFFHRNIIKYQNRPFDFNDENCIIDDAKRMITRHNEIISPDDFVLMVGDISAGLKGRTLNGRKILIRGNHDYLPDKFYKDAGVIDVVTEIVIDEFFICHYPCYYGTWTKKVEQRYIDILNENKCTKIIHGHCHSKDPASWTPDGFERLNVCIDFPPNNYYPVELTENKIKQYLKEKYK